jgi:hypothetical protein
MAKEIFITQWFSQEMLLAGQSLIERLDKADKKVYAAFWLLDAEEKIWKLIIVSPLVGNEGPKKYYRCIDDINDSALSDESVIALHDISLSHTDNHIVKAIKNSAYGDNILRNIRLGKNTLGGVYVEDMYLYRMDWELLNDTTVDKETIPLSSQSKIA